MAVTLHNGTYYLCEFETEQKKQNNDSRTQRDDEMCCWGWKFEQYMTAGSCEHYITDDFFLSLKVFHVFCYITVSLFEKKYSGISDMF